MNRPASLLLLLVVSLLYAPLLAQDSSAVYTLDQLLERAYERNTDIAMARLRVDGARAQLREAKAAFILPRLRLESVGGLVPDQWVREAVWSVCAVWSTRERPPDSTGGQATGCVGAPRRSRA